MLLKKKNIALSSSTEEIEVTGRRPGSGLNPLKGDVAQIPLLKGSLRPSKAGR
jgi:hypothetical protein